MPSAAKRVELKDALEDSPQTQGIVDDMERSIYPLKEFSTRLRDGFQTLYANQVRVSESLKTIGSVLDSVTDKSFGEKDPFMAEAINQLGKYVSELQSWQEMLCAQIDTALVQQLNSFISTDTNKLIMLKDAFYSARNEHAQAINKYNKVSKKKETERSRFDANSELFSSRRRFHQSSLQYYAELNSFSFKKKFAVLDPLLAYMHSQLAYFKMGHEILTDEVGKFLTSLNVEIQKVRSEHEQTMKQQQKVGEQLEQLSPQVCIPDPDPSDPFVEYCPANLHLSKKAGYLNTKTGPKTWERMYFYTKDHLLYTQVPQKAPNVLMDLTAAGVDASSTDIDDKRYAFNIMTLEQVTDNETGNSFIQKRPMYFQAESAKSRDEWVATIINIVSKRRQQQQPRASTLPANQGQPGMKRELSDTDIVRLERERVKSFVQSVGGTPKKQQPQPPTPQKHLQPAQQPMGAGGKPQQRPRPPPPPVRGNSTVQQLLEMADAQNLTIPDGVGYEKRYVVRYLGTLEVQQKSGVSVVKDTIRRIVAARALKNLMTVYIVNMIVTHKEVCLQDQVSKRITTSFKLKDISYCAKHPDNEKLFGVIARVVQNNVEKHVCYVFEAEGEFSGKAICQSIIEAIKVAVKFVTGAQTAPQPNQDEQSIPSFDLPQTVFNATPTQPPPHPGMSKSISTGSFKSGSLNFPEDNSFRQPNLNDSFNETEENLIDVSGEPQVPPAVAPPTNQQQQQYYTVPDAVNYEPVYTVPHPSGGQPGDDQPPPLPPRRHEEDLMDLTTPPPAEQSATPTTSDLLGLSDIQSATEQAQLSGSAPPTGTQPPTQVPTEPATNTLVQTPYNNTTAGSGYEYDDSDPFGLDDILPRPSSTGGRPPSVGATPQTEQPLLARGQDPFDTGDGTGTNPFN